MAICWIRPSFMTAIRSAMANASCWSWVTNTAVRAGRLEDRAHVAGEDLAQAGVEVRERLVEQQQARRRGQRPGQRDPLLLPAGELVRPARAGPFEADRGEQLGGARSRRRRRPAMPKATLRRDVEMREQGEVLEHHADAPLLRRQVAAAGLADDRAVDGDPAGGDALEAADAAQHRRLAAAGGAEQAADLAAGERQVEVGEGRYACRSDGAMPSRASTGAAQAAPSARSDGVVGFGRHGMGDLTLPAMLRAAPGLITMLAAALVAVPVLSVGVNVLSPGHRRAPGPTSPPPSCPSTSARRSCSASASGSAASCSASAAPGW